MKKYGIICLLLVVTSPAQEPQGIKRKAPEPEHSYLANLPADIKVIIASFLACGITLTQALDNVKTLTRVNRHFRDVLTDPNRLFVVLNAFADRFKKSSLEIAIKMNTRASLAIANQLQQESLKKYDEYQKAHLHDQELLFNYLNSLAILNDPKASSYVYYLSYRPMFVPAIRQAAIQATVSDNFEVFKLLINAGFFNFFSEAIIKVILTEGRLHYLNYLIQNNFEIQHIHVTHQARRYTLVSFLQHVLLAAPMPSPGYTERWRAVEKRLKEIGAD